MNRSKAYLATEFSVIFAGVPLIFYFELVRVPKILPLVAVTVFVLMVLLRDGEYKKRELWSLDEIDEVLPGLLVKFVLVFAVLVILVMVTRPQALFNFPRQRLQLWGLVMVLYPLMSAFPQEVIYRGFIFHRYKELLPEPWMKVATSTLAFSFLHIIYDNVPAVLLTLGGGYLFSRTYLKTRSVLITAIEHAIYGCCVFTIGLGHYFYEAL